MKRLSNEAAFAWVQRFVAREWSLLLPIALAFIALPALAADLLVPDAVWRSMLPGADPASVAAGSAGWVFPLLMMVLILNLAGDLAISALGLTPGISVGEAILVALRRLPLTIGAILLTGAAVLGCALVLMVLLGTMRIDRAALQGLTILAIWGTGLFLCVRLVTLVPLIVARRLTPARAIRASWALGRGTFWPVLAGLAMYVVGGLIVLLALNSALGAVLILLGRGIGQAELGAVLAKAVFRIGTAVFATGLQLLTIAFYRQLAGDDRRD